MRSNKVGTDKLYVFGSLYLHDWQANDNALKENELVITDKKRRVDLFNNHFVHKLMLSLTYVYMAMERTSLIIPA